MSKRTCPITRAQFAAQAKPIPITLNRDTDIVASVKEAFSSGSFGWYGNGKFTVIVDGQSVDVQVGINLTVIGSKEAPADATTKPV